MSQPQNLGLSINSKRFLISDNVKNMALEAGSVIAKFKADISDMKSGISQVKSQVGSMGSSFKNAGSQMASAGEAIATGLAVIGAAMAVVGYKAIKVTGDLESQRMAFKTLLGTVEEADKAIEMIKKDAASTPFEMMGLINANKLLTAVTGNAQDSEKMLLDVGKAIAATGGGQEQLDRIIVNLQQIGSVGKASMIDIKQFAFAGIPIFKMLEQSTGKSGEALGDMISNGEISFDVLKKMFAEAGNGSGKFANAFVDQAGTFNQLVSNMKDTFAIFSVEIMTKTGIFDGVKAGITRVMDYLAVHKDDIINFITNTISAISTFGDKAKALMQPVIDIIVQFFSTVENRKAFLYGFFIAVGAMLAAFVIGFLIAHATIILIFTGIIAVVVLFSKMWNENWFGIQETTATVLGWIRAAMDLFKAGWDAWGKDLWNAAKLAFSSIWQYIKFVFNAITDTMAFFYLLFTGQWGAMWELIKSATQARWNDIKAIFATAIEGVKQYLNGLYDFFVGRFTDMWNKAKELADKIRHAISSAFDKDERNSPSIADRLREVVAFSTDELKKVAIPSFSSELASNIAGITSGINLTRDTPDQVGGQKIINQYITNNVADTLDIDVLNERLAFNYRNA